VSTRIQENLNGIPVNQDLRQGETGGRAIRRRTRAVLSIGNWRRSTARLLFFPVHTAVVGFLSNVFMIGLGGFYMLKDMSLRRAICDVSRLLVAAVRAINTLAPGERHGGSARGAAGKRVFEVLECAR